MAKESDPDSRPITVEELIARTSGEDAFPRADSLSVRRSAPRRPASTGDAGEETGSASARTASGMPDHRPPASRPSSSSPRVIGASGMPAHTPGGGAKPPKDTANAVTGIIPVVSDDDEEVPSTGQWRAVDRDDLLGEDLPVGEQPVGERPAVGDLETGDRDTGDLETGDRDTGDSEAGKRDDTGIGAANASATAALTSPTAFAGTTTAGETAGVDFSGVAMSGADTARGDTARVDLGAEDGGETDHLASAGELAAAQREDDEALEAQADAGEEADAGRGPVWGWLGLIGEVILGLAIGAGLFWGFTVLWRQYVYFALVLAVLVIFAIVTFAYVLRKRDLPTTLLALAVGLIVTIGPLVLLV